VPIRLNPLKQSEEQSKLELMFFRECLECGRKTLTYCNSLCKTCSLSLTLKEIVAATTHVAVEPTL
jgi:hypothetical protein